MWENALKIEKLQTGDVLEAKGKVPFFPHYAVVYKKNNELYVTHCVDNGVTDEPLKDFEKKRTIYNVFRNEVTKKLTDEFIQEKAKELKAYGYNFMEMNCEDYAKRIVGTYIGVDDRTTAIIVISLIIITSLIVTITIMSRKLK